MVLVIVHEQNVDLVNILLRISGAAGPRGSLVRCLHRIYHVSCCPTAPLSRRPAYR